jgi:hypothetical protein
MIRRFATALRALALLSIGVFCFAGLPDNGLPDNGLPDNGLPDNGLPDNGLPDNGNSPDALINSPLFFNKRLHAYWVGRPFSAATLSAPGNPLARILVDKFSAMVMAYQWQLCHPAGDDAVVTDAAGGKHTFQGLIGLCVQASGSGWHKDTALDLATARWLSAATITQVNRYQVHNRFSLRGAHAQQLTAMTPSLTSYKYKFGTDLPVEALQACKTPSSGKAKCGWKPHYVGLGKQGTRVRVSAKSFGHKVLLQVNLGIHAANPGEQGAIAISGNKGTVDPHVDFVIPQGGTFNVQWAADPRPMGTALPATVQPPDLTATATHGNGNVHLPADEVFVFPNREMYVTAMLFNLAAGDRNIADIPGAVDGKPVASCEPNVNENGSITYCVGIEAPPQPTDAKQQTAQRAATEGCTPCTRTLKAGQRFLTFPNAHMWLSSGWNKEQDYYSLRSCSSDLSSCVAKFEGFIDIDYCGPSNPRCHGGAAVVAKKCDVQSKSVDTSTARTYLGPVAALDDASQCHIGSGPDTGFGATTFFANYGNEGGCFLSKKKGEACHFQKPHCREPKKGEAAHHDCGKDDDDPTHGRGCKPPQHHAKK